MIRKSEPDVEPTTDRSTRRGCLKQTVVTTRIVRRSIKSIKFTTLKLAPVDGGRQLIAPKMGEAVVIATLLSTMMWVAIGWAVLG